jgi:methylmalonyl-CoA/ethylmalonyl-CoA epimerase
LRIRFHHLGFVVASIEACIEPFMRSVGAVTRSGIILDPIQRVKVAFLFPADPEAPQIELVEPAEERSPVVRFLEMGGGLHHICYEVPDIDAQLKYMRSEGGVVIRGPRPGVAFDNRRIAWVLSREKLLIEYLEADQGAST